MIFTPAILYKSFPSIPFSVMTTNSGCPLCMENPSLQQSLSNSHSSRCKTEFKFQAALCFMIPAKAELRGFFSGPLLSDPGTSSVCLYCMNYHCIVISDFLSFLFLLIDCKILNSGSPSWAPIIQHGGWSRIETHCHWMLSATNYVFMVHSELIFSFAV